MVSMANLITIFEMDNNKRRNYLSISQMVCYKKRNVKGDKYLVRNFFLFVKYSIFAVAFMEILFL